MGAGKSFNVEGVGRVGMLRLRSDRGMAPHLVGLDMLAGVWQAGGMKKQGSDQAFHDRRHQERKRAEAERNPVKKKVDGEKAGTGGGKQGGESPVPDSE